MNNIFINQRIIFIGLPQLKSKVFPTLLTRSYILSMQACNGQAQSPIDIKKKDTTVVKEAPPLNFEYKNVSAHAHISNFFDKLF